ncbi:MULTISPECIES: response regulator transcription factor [unclassified Streptomyces]|uniref:response regulator transcription factor n=1 Tax=unclassified Streptomyces TaxID=2593676 RepID=UPI002DD8836D|nr:MULTISPECIES: response regulator transcription factor [unclassified Streptomyces]WSA93355.1 response regulator transcription factor [Streptomyces sp. NBC_01795]WSB77722.1 response regulator transcription factor [Streptomyces sp. NBC_01775]WSS14029.1 response regulator transcription factor [Streptomyces sp. NBC_01186]WSS42848.1 response regulator transcription factor [Streptomyces sp. NBC_01187]
MTVKVVLLDDEELVRRGIRMILNAEPDIEVVAEGDDGSVAMDLVAEHCPDVVLTDIQMPRVDGLEVAQQLAALPDPPAVAVLTTFDVDEYVYAALQHGAAGFLLKDTSSRELTDAVRVLARGEAMLSPRITTKLLAAFATGAAGAQARSRMAELTAREREVAMAVAQGHSNSEIATDLFVSQSTVKVHLTRIMTKLDAANRTQVALITHDAGLT